ncbi:Aste57867_24035 [Aphanomyces stellatus]|uniref:Aste57867_24035 protein n=1 Tax=Aphanomyces stellatus TaxID=120398 RepID=A0A485LR49_9STRA|nr:hypothetical protein As57867_023962 [Aphanomyces stellatus]VFU00678.1 Aste57867_24035 [Aphanomyces stellatus]
MKLILKLPQAPPHIKHPSRPKPTHAAAVMAATSPSRGRRRQTVNERIDGILDDFCRSSIVRPEDADPQHHDSMRLSQLYEVSLQDRYLKQRVHALPSPISSDRQRAISRQKFSRERASLPPTAASLTSSHATLELLPVSPIKASQSVPKLQPWYVGHNNAADGPVCSLQAKAKRYGARGAVQLAAVDTVAGTVPPLHPTRQHAFEGLDNLGKFQHPNTWSPTLAGSPTLWSEEAAYVYGAPLAFHNTRKPHVEPAAKSKLPLRSDDDHAARLNGKLHAELAALEATLAHDQDQARATFAATRETLEAVMAQQRIKLSRHVHAAKVPARAMKDMTLVQTTGPPRVAAISAKLLHCKFDLRWKTMFHLADAMRRTATNRPILQELALLLARIVESGTRHQRANPYELTRDQCRELFAKEYPAFGLENFNLMYSSFDPTHTDHLDMRDVVATLRALRMSNANTRANSMKDVVLDLVGLYANEALVHVYHVQRVLALFCGSTDDEVHLEQRLATLFYAYRPFRNLHGTVTMDEVENFVTEQSALVDLFTGNLVARRRQVNSLSINGEHT